MDRYIEKDPATGFSYEYRAFTDDRPGGERDRMLGVVPFEQTPGYRVESMYVTLPNGRVFLKTGRFPIEPDEKPVLKPKGGDLGSKSLKELLTIAGMEGLDPALQKVTEPGVLIQHIKAKRAEKEKKTLGEAK